jgi:hypothetical protein
MAWWDLKLTPLQRQSLWTEERQVGCICPPTSEKTCENPTCPRKAPDPRGHSASNQ